MQQGILRTVIGIVAGVGMTIATISLCEYVGHLIWPLPPGLDPMKPDQMAQILAAMPFAAKLSIAVGWFLGTLVGGFVALGLSKRTWAPWPIAALVIAGGIANGLMFPHPLWMDVAAVVAPVLGAWIATRLGKA